MGHPVLRLVAQPVDPKFITHPKFQDFLDDMVETMDEYDGAGLAAPQVHTSIRVALLTLDSETGPEFLINPEITALTTETVRTVEGCLSIDGIRGAVHRPAKIRVSAFGRDGQRKAYELSGFPAVVTQHECDHLDGTLFIDKVDLQTLAFLPEYHRYGALDQAGLIEGEMEHMESTESTTWPDEIVIIEAGA